MTSKDIVLTAHRNMGRSDALTLREKAVAGELTDTQIINQEQAVPLWGEKKDYTEAKVGTPVQHDGQVYGLLQPHNAAHYPGTTPANAPALWSIKHTTNPEKAKPWMEPNGTSGLYYLGECYKDEAGVVYRQTYDGGNPYNAATLPDRWAVVT